MNRVVWSVAALLGVAGALAPSWAGAEIYGWVDDSGRVTYSNLPPPKGARVIEMIDEVPPGPNPAPPDAAHQAQLQALNDRVRQLERQLQQTQYPPPPPMPRSAASSGPVCDSEYFDCDASVGPVYYTPGALAYWPPHRHRDGRHPGFHHPPRSGGSFLRSGATPHH